jgi:hypothetical protein
MPTYANNSIQTFLWKDGKDRDICIPCDIHDFLDDCDFCDGLDTVILAMLPVVSLVVLTNYMFVTAMILYSILRT